MQTRRRSAALIYTADVFITLCPCVLVKLTGNAQAKEREREQKTTTLCGTRGSCSLTYLLFTLYTEVPILTVYFYPDESEIRFTYYKCSTFKRTLQRRLYTPSELFEKNDEITRLNSIPDV